jgi:hypothetical protein
LFYSPEALAYQQFGFDKTGQKLTKVDKIASSEANPGVEV